MLLHQHQLRDPHQLVEADKTMPEPLDRARRISPNEIGWLAMIARASRLMATTQGIARGVAVG
ncbi:hypothetical protein IP81_16225 [Novosphingobium sp. AAP83]|nr:hypothetical protein IP81_16225 [Novosphingobium sp. AAP83]